ncbi:MAG: ribonuclease P protein component [Acidobacteria bacterium]|nr:MAG: ribonuclease P protein component [Acidobacteriota bacterium]
MPSHTLPPARRLRRRGEFQRVFDAGRRSHGRFLTVIAAPGQGPTARLGVVASRKLGGAVVRNRAKRLIREMFRTSSDAGPVDLVVIPKTALLEASRPALEQDFESALKRFRVPSKQ